MNSRLVGCAHRLLALMQLWNHSLHICELINSVQVTFGLSANGITSDGVNWPQDLFEDVNVDKLPALAGPPE